MIMRRLIILFSMIGMLWVPQVLRAQDKVTPKSEVVTDSLQTNDSLLVADSIAAEAMLADDPEADTDENGGFH